MRKILLALLMLVAAIAVSAEEVALPFVWSDQTGTRDMPWMGKGGRAHWFVIDKTKPWDFMNPRGPTLERHWGSSGRSGTSPYEDAEGAMAYLASVGFMKRWPVYPEDSSQKDAIALPYRITIVAIQPVVAILRFDLSAAIDDPIEFAFGAFPPSHRDHSTDQGLGWSKTPNRIMFGTRVVDHGPLLWFCPEANVPPTPLEVPGGRGQVALKDFRLDIEKKGEELEFTWRAR